MSVLHQLSSALNRRDEEANIELAEKIAVTDNVEAVQEMVHSIGVSKAAIQNDCIKVLYEIGERKPELIAPHLNLFVELLKHKNNRLQWGAMTALNHITATCGAEMYKVLHEIMKAAETGSVITKDQAVQILIQLCQMPKYREDAFQLLNEMILKSPENQLPMYAERTLPAIHETNKEKFLTTLKHRLADVEKESKKKRIEKIIRKLG